MRANLEALVTLEPIFRQHVTALAPKIAAIVQEYLERCERAREPSDDRVSLILTLLTTQPVDSQQRASQSTSG